MRDEVADRRDEAGNRRDNAAVLRDDEATARDEAATLRDLAADNRDSVAEQAGATLSATVIDLNTRLERTRQEAAFDRTRASADRRAGAAERTKSELDRDTSFADRGAGATERSKSGRDRGTAMADRDASAHDREEASLDGLTGVYVRSAGCVEIERELARAKRSHQPLALAYVDVDGLKATNDQLGHAAGDRMLVEVAETMAAELRSYDVLVRYGGDEFVCVMPGLDGPAATAWLGRVNAALAAGAEHGSVTVGLAQLAPEDTLEELIERADVALYVDRAARLTRRV